MVQLRQTCGRISRLQHWLAGRAGVAVGGWGEWIALRHLQRSGFDIVVQNWRTRRGEIDLIAYDGSYLVFVEVKTRTKPSRFPPELQVDESKKDRLETLANSFLIRHELSDTPIRFDLVAVETEDLRSFEIRHYTGFM